MCPEMFSEIGWGDCWHNILFSCAEAEPVLLPVLQARWRSSRQRKSVLVSCTAAQVLGWPRTGVGAEPCSSLPSFVLALHSGALGLSKDLAPAVGLGARAGGPGSACCSEPICPRCVRGRAGSSGADGSSASPGCVWQGVVVCWCLCSVATLLWWSE